MDEEEFKATMRVLLVIAVILMMLLMFWCAAKEAGCGAFFSHTS